MKVAAVQMDILWHNRKANHEKAWDFALQARDWGADLFILPEMFSTGFSMERSVTAEPLDGPTPTMLRSMARELDMIVTGGFVLERSKEGARNVCMTVGRNGEDMALYAKIHQIALLGEDISYEPGDRPVLFDLQGHKATCFICYDLRFPELFRAVVDECSLIIVIASWPAVRQSHWDLLLRARAVESQCYLIGVNRVGEGGGHVFAGGSAVIDPLGQVISEGGLDNETLVMADIDLSKVQEVRTAMPFLKDRKSFLLV